MENEKKLREEIDFICEKYYRDVYQYCLYFTNHHNEAEDLTQETFLKVLKGLKKFKNHSSIKTWVLSIAKHTAIDHYRRKKIIQFIPSLLLPSEVAIDGLPEQEVQAKENWQEIEHALHLLKPHYRNILILRGIKELSTKETAEILDCKEAKVRVDYHRAIKQLHLLLSPQQGGVLTNETPK